MRGDCQPLEEENKTAIRRAGGKHFLCKSKTSLEPEPLWLSLGYWAVPERPDHLLLYHHI